MAEADILIEQTRALLDSVRDEDIPYMRECLMQRAPEYAQRIIVYEFKPPDNLFSLN